MNRIYRSIWNQATGAYAAVSENVKSAGKRSMPGCSGGGAHFALTSMAAALMLGYGSLALAGPTGGTVVAGQATINGAPGATVIHQGSQNAVINWASFNVGQGESVQFRQPNSNAVALNRVLGSDGTTILGNLSANGKVFIVNPNGVLFGQGASVNTAGLVASTLDINNADFMAGKYQFSGNGTGKVLNQGSISAPGGYVALLGANVSNEGTIQARLGSVALAAGRAITLDVAGDGLLNVAVNAGAVGALVNNGGMIRADGGSVLLSAQAAGDLLKTVVNNTGVIEAQTIDTRSGTIKLLGDMQTGTVNAGGTLDASAPAGEVGSRGGFIDTSAAHVHIAKGINVTTQAANGLSGTWLIDPVDFTIAASGGNMTGTDLMSSLTKGSVQILSTDGNAGTAGDVNVNEAIAWSANKLTLTAQNNININKPMTGTGTASLALEYGQSAVAASNAAHITIKAEVNLPSGNSFSTKQGSDGTTKVYTMITSLGAAGSVTGTDLQGMRNLMSGNYALGANIDASATSSWGANGFIAIGTNTTPFTGQFEGLGHVITGLTSSNSTSNVSAALFGTITTAAQIRNVGMLGVNMSSSVPGSGSYGNAAGLVGSNSGLINNAYVTGSLSTPGYAYIGGLVGKNSGTILNSSSNATISVTNATLDTVIGGLVGLATKASKITGSYNTGAVTATTKHTGGGLVGINYGAITNSFNTGAVSVGIDAGGLVASNRGSGALINNSFSTGAVSGSGHVGGLVGWTTSSSQINNSYATGTVTGLGLGGLASAAVSTGGLVGNNRSLISNSYATGDVTGATSSVGGVVGANGMSTAAGSVTNVYSSGKATLTGTVAGTTVAGGVIGFNNATATITGGYFNSTVNTVSAIGGGTGTVTSVSGLSATQMRTGASFGTFSFTTTTGQSGNNWVIVNTDGTLNGAGNATGATGPMLSSEYSTTIKSPHQLQLMAMNLAGNYTLARDLNVAATGTTGDVWNGATFVPVGTSTAAPFTGTFDGAAHVISGLVLNRPGIDSTGLFGATSSTAVIRDVGLEGGSVNGATDTATLAGNNAGTISGSYSTMSVTGTANTGGLVGNNSGTVSNSYASGAVTGANTVGGLVGVNSGALTNNYATGAVTASSNTGGLAGASTGSATGNFWDTATSGQATSAAGTGLTTTHMKSPATYSAAAWDQANTWIIYDSNTYPLLRAFMTPLQVNFALNNSKTYDGTSTFTASGVTASRPGAYASLLGTLSTGAAGNAVNAGTYAITAGGLYSGQRGYIISYNTGTVTIDRRAVTLSGATVASRDYDGTTAAMVSGGSLVGVLAQDNVNLTVNTGTFDSKDVGSGKTVTAIVTGSASGNYAVTANALTGNITQKALTVSGVTVASKSYDGNTKATISGGTLNGLVIGESLTLSGQSGAFNDKDAGNGKAVTVTGATLGNGSGLASNYTVSNATDATGNITPKALTVTGATAADKVYDGGTAATVSGGSLSGLVGSETLGLSSLTGVFGDKNVANGRAVTVTGGAISNGSNGGLASNYTVSAVTGLSASITPKALTLSGMLVSAKAYDGNTKATLTGGTLNGLVVGETVSFSGQSGVFADKDAGSGKSVTVTGTTLVDGNGLASNYSLTNPSGVTGDITPKALTISGVTATNRVYDGGVNVTLAGSVLLGGLVGSETFDVTGISGVFADKNAGTGKAVTLSGATLGNGANGGLVGNYTVSNPTGVTANITQATISSVSNIVAVDKVYDANTKATVSATGATFNGMVGGDSLTISSTSATFADKNAGNGKTVAVSGIALGGTDAGNYNLMLTTGSGSGNITPKALTITGMSAVNKAYDGNTKASLSGGSISGLVGSETLGVMGLSATFDTKDAGTGKTVTATGSTLVNGGNGGLAANYTINNPTGLIASITPKALTVSGMTAGTRVYDGTTAATLAGGSLSGLVTGETLVVSGGSGVFGDKNAGNGKAVTVSGVSLLDGTGLASNYTVSNPTNVTGSITQKALSVTGALAADKTYDGALDATITGGSLSGFVASETVGLASLVGAFLDKNAGSGKAVSVTGGTLSNGSNGGLASNYSVGPVTGLAASIAQKTLTVTGMSAANKVYDGTTKATVTGGALNGLVGGETLGLSGLSGAFGDKNAGTGKAVTVSGAQLADGTGLASNYTLSNPTGVTANISPASISSVTNVVADSKVYDGGTSVTFATATATFNGMVSGDSLAIGATKAAFSDKNAGTGKGVTISFLTLGGTDAANYTLASTTATGSGTITPKALTINGMSAVNKVYDGSTKATLSGGSISGLVGSETLGVTGLSATFDTKDAGTGKTVTATGSTLVNGGNGGLAANYTISNPTGLIASITPKALTVSGMTAGTRVYDGTTAATLAGGSLSGLVTGETLVVSGGSGVFGDKNAGNGKAVTVSGVSLADGTGLASNYTVSNPTNLIASITPKALTVTGVTAGNKTYDGSIVASLSGGTLDGLVGTETLLLSGQSGLFSDKNAGTGKDVTVSGATLGDAGSGATAGLAHNYTVSNVTGLKADIAQKALTVGGITAGNKVYDGQTGATLDTSAATFDGMIANDSLTASASGAFGDKNAATGKTVNIEGIALGGADAGNYVLASNQASTKADIAARALTLSGQVAGNKVYDGNANASLSGGVLTGLVAGETLAIGGQTALFNDKNAANGKAITVTGTTLVDGTGLASNYSVSDPTGLTASITPKALTVAGQVAGNKVYDGNAVAQLSGGSLVGLVGGETLAIGGQSAAFSDKNAGNAKTVTVSGTTLLDGTGAASNYTVANPTGLTASITPAAIRAIAGIVAANKVYDGGTAASLNLADASFTGMVAGDALSLASGPVLGAFSDKNAALGKTVSISGLGLAGADAGNYVLFSNLASTTADITPAALTVSASGVNKVYDATTNAVVSLRDNRIGNDLLSIASNGASFSDKNAGVGKTVMVAGIRLSGADAGNYVVNTIASTTATISQAALTVKVDNAEKDQGRANPDFTASYSGLLGGDTVAAEVSGSLAFGTPATTASVAGNYLVSASGQASNNYALNYVDGVLEVKPTQALQSAVASVIAAVAVAPSQGNMVQADMIVSGETAPGKPAATQDAPREGEKGSAGSAPVVQLAGNVVSNVLPGLRLSVVDSGLRLPAEAGGKTRQDSQ